MYYEKKKNLAVFAFKKNTVLYLTQLRSPECSAMPHIALLNCLRVADIGDIEISAHVNFGTLMLLVFQR